MKKFFVSAALALFALGGCAAAPQDTDDVRIEPSTANTITPEASSCGAATEGRSRIFSTCTSVGCGEQCGSAWFQCRATTNAQGETTYSWWQTGAIEWTVNDSWICQ
jgi:hypothetical protein